jgi:putative methionine-R-sulfoxide reductase with GAF domain/PAS domain-containing protein
VTSEPGVPDDVPIELPELLGRPPTAERVMAELAKVQIAHEELRVAEEELRVQQEQLTSLLRQHDGERRWRAQLGALVPVGLCATDGNGALVEANPALAAQLGTRLALLQGKPLSVYLAAEDVSAFRSALRRLTSAPATEEQLQVTLRPRDLPPEQVQLFGFTDTADHRPSIARVQWVVVPESAAPEPAGLPTGEGPEQPIPTSDVVGLASALAELSALPVEQGDRQKLLSRMATLVRGAVPAADWVSITIGPPMEPQRLGTDSAEAQDFDGRQVRAGEGPCWQAYLSATVVVTDDVQPTLSRISPPSAVRSVLAVPVREDGETTGVVNVYSGRTHAFSPAGQRIAELTAAAVAGVLQSVTERESLQHLADNLERALVSRAVIDQAKGMIMARLDVGADDAFARLVKLSSRLNVKIRDLAALVVEGHVDDVLHAAD